MIIDAPTAATEIVEMKTYSAREHCKSLSFTRGLGVGSGPGLGFLATHTGDFDACHSSGFKSKFDSNPSLQTYRKV